MKIKIIIGGLILGLLLSAIAAYFIIVGSPVKSVSVTQASSKGFWKGIDADGENSPAFFCSNTGAYKGHISNSGKGWWFVFNGDKKLGSFASEEFAKRSVEDDAECK